MSTTMHFGPEWMRPKNQTPSRPQPPPSPPPASHAPPSSASTYSALVSPAPPLQPEKRDDSHPFRYSKEEMLRIYKEGGGRGGLGLEVERWEGVVREVGSEPVGLRDMADGEKKLFAGPLNSETRRRQSTDYLSPLTTSHSADRPRLNHNNSSAGSPLRERFGSLMGRRRDSTDQPPLPLPRKSSISSAQGPAMSSREGALPSRTRGGHTPGFDGILNGGDSWMSRRRTSEGLTKAGSTLPRGGGGGGDHPPETNEAEIKEQDDVRGGDIYDETSTMRGSPAQTDPSQVTPSDAGPSETTKTDITAVVQGFSGLTINTSHNSISATSGPMSGIDTTTIELPPGLPDLTSIEWSYLDPQGQVQGPFRADLMQKWYDDGYFTQDLLMKRTHFDTDWTPVGELGRRAAGEKIFLSLSIASTAPPGLSRRTESPVAQVLQDQNVYNDPYQPTPTRSTRPSTFDAFVGSVSNPSDSPSSSFGVGRFSNESPDPTGFGGRVGSNFYSPGDPSAVGRTGGFATGPEPSLFGAARRSTYNESPVEPSTTSRGGSFGNLPPGRTASIDSYGFNGFDVMTPGRSSVDPMNQFSSNYGTPGQSSGLGSSAALNHPSSLGHLRGPQDTAFHDNSVGSTGFGGPEYRAPGDLGISPEVQSSNRPPLDERLPNIGFNNSYVNGFGATSFGGPNQPQVQPYTQSPSLQFSSQHPLQQPQSPQVTIVGQPLTASPKENHIQSAHVQNIAVSPVAVSQSPWASVEPTTIRRPGPFDPAHPTSSNTIVTRSITPSQPSPWGRTSQTSHTPAQTNDASPWYAASQDIIDDSWKEIPGPNSLTFSNLGEHNQRQRQQEELGLINENVHLASTNVDEVQQPLSQPLTDISAPAPASAVPSTIASLQPPKSRRKSTTQQNQQVQPPIVKPPALPVPARKTPSPPLSAQPKPAWSTDEDSKKAKPSGVTLGLREIQEAEAKKLEARKITDRERERAARSATVASATNDEIQPFTASWGLPTSQTGSRSVPSSKESLAATGSNPGTSVTPVWTNSVKGPPAKKTMKEIQEEEERRKKTTVKETTAAAAARRAYAETTNKASVPTQSVGAAWTTVGPSGKSAVTVAPTRPPITPSTSTASVAGSPSTVRTSNGAPASRQAAAAPPTKAVPIAASRSEDFPVSPSHDFLKWLSDSLKGLNNSVNFEEITSMLLQFPIDPPPSTVELISDLIYANSTTLDGRRFASEFVNRRKSDAAAPRAKNSGAAGASAKPVSIADVVKAQPKSSQPEWGGFKVVNKKKKGGR